MNQSIYQFKIKDASGTTVPLSDYEGKVLLIVNTASKCGFTPQFEKLEELYQEFKQDDFLILGFPSNDFAGQEPNEADKAQEFCQINYGVTFPMFATTVVRGDDAHPIFKELEEKTAAPYWNFYKYLVSNDGQSVQRFSSKVEPQSEELVAAIKQEL